MIDKVTGVEEGEPCGRIDGRGLTCEGILEFQEPDNCSCHINPPCSACTSVKLYCPVCNWVEEDG